MTITNTPTLTRRDTPQGRYYTAPGIKEPMPSVTTVLGMIAKPHLAGWQTHVALTALVDAVTERQGGGASVDLAWLRSAAQAARGAADRQRDAAANFGSRAHDLIERRIKHGGPLAEYPAELATVLSNFEAWLTRYQFRFEWAERGVFSAKFGYAGTVDCLATRNGKLAVLDWKTGQLHDEAALQVSAYAKAWEEMTGQHVEECWVIRFPRTGDSVQVKQVKDIDLAFTLFRAALHLWKAQRAGLLAAA